MTEALNASEFLELVAGERCPCGHVAGEHAAPNPEPIGTFIETMGACELCPCRGVVE